jgi:hypothetical protein
MRSLRLIATLAVLGAATPAGAVFIGNVQGGTDFPQGALSFADALVDYSPGLVGGTPTLPHRDGGNAVGLPDYLVASATDCPSQAECEYTTLGDGGSVTLRFIDNALTGSGDAALDLWVFEIGGDIEDTFVEISEDGVAWSAVGKVFGSTQGVDIDAFGFGVGDLFLWVRLTDDTDEGQQDGTTVGADIDAVGAITTVATPEPGAAALTLCAAVAGAVRLRRRR